MGLVERMAPGLPIQGAEQVPLVFIVEQIIREE